MKRRIVPDGRTRTCRLNLPKEEQTLLRLLPAELATILRKVDTTSGPPEALRRLFPRAYVSDDEAESSYAASMQPELTASQLRSLDVLVETASSRALTEEQMGDWMAALTDLRLVLGTVLGVTDDKAADEPLEDIPGQSEAVIYQYLTMLQAELIDVMEQWLPEPVEGADDLVPDDPWGEPLGGLRWDGTPQPEWPPRPEW